ncbi:hypothetical protein JCM33374_g5060 [Metschnikowia sp. JCM 33374]|nr:hypothetical protein JCM33374_g5060 [Metschnikowia sp. JCM 33374]
MNSTWPHETLQKNFITDLFLYKEVFRRIRKKKLPETPENNSGQNPENSRNGSLKTECWPNLQTQLESKVEDHSSQCNREISSRNLPKISCKPGDSQSSLKCIPFYSTSENHQGVCFRHQINTQKSTSPIKKRIRSWKKESAKLQTRPSPEAGLGVQFVTRQFRSSQKFRLGHRDQNRSERDTSPAVFVASSHPPDRRDP